MDTLEVMHTYMFTTMPTYKLDSEKIIKYFLWYGFYIILDSSNISVYLLTLNLCDTCTHVHIHYLKVIKLFLETLCALNNITAAEIINFINTLVLLNVKFANL